MGELRDSLVKMYRARFSNNLAQYTFAFRHDLLHNIHPSISNFFPRFLTKNYYNPQLTTKPSVKFISTS